MRRATAYAIAPNLLLALQGLPSLWALPIFWLSRAWLLVLYAAALRAALGLRGGRLALLLVLPLLPVLGILLLAAVTLVFTVVQW